MIIDELDIRLTGWGSIVLRFDELAVVLRHWRMILFYALCWALLLPFFLAGDSVLGAGLRLAAVLLVQLAVLGLVLVAALMRRAAGRGRSVLWLSGWIAAGVGGAMVLWQGLGPALGWGAPVGAARLAIMAGLAVLLAELQAAVAVRWLIPRLVAGLRAAQDRPANPMQDGGANPLPRLVVGQKNVLLHDLLHIRAEGNYVEVTLRGGGRLFTLATLRSVVAQVPEGEGMLIHRSLWIAAGAFAGYRRAGADLHVRTADGREFKVAKSRHAEVLPWLKARAAELARAG